MSTGIIVGIIGIAVGAIGLIFAIIFGLISVRELKELPKIGDGILKIGELVRLDGEEIRKTILEAHNSIKRELIEKEKK